MTTTLCIDWGNTLVKAALFNVDGEMVETQQFSENEAAAGIKGMIDAHQPKAGILCSVTDQSAEVEKQLKAQIPGFIKLDSNTRLPVMNAYSSPESLGADRLALAVGIQDAFPGQNCLAVGLGTCITYNFVQKNKAFRGGAISPGMQMRLKAMHDYTNKLPEVDAGGELLLLGYDTPSCMRSGAIFGMAAEIDGMVAAFADQYPDFNAVLTGGDAPYFASKLKSKIFADPDLLLKGLNLILKYNVPQLR
jgi:type III pantothenate kinase